MKKKTIIILGAVAVIAVGGIVTVNALNKNAQQVAVKQAPKDDWGIDYFDVPDLQQIYINGVIQPEQMEAFARDQKITKDPEIKVKNGDVVDAGTELFTYEDEAVTKEIEAQQNSLAKLETKRANIYNKWNRAIDKFNKTKEEDRTISGDDLNEQYQTEVDAVDEEITFTNETLADLGAKQYISTKANFKGRVSIPEVKDANSPILRLTSEDLYLAGKVNEKDLTKISVGQKAKLTSVSNNVVVDGSISYIDDNPPEGNSDAASGNPEGGTTMSNYSVKIALANLDKVKNGYHMQATIDLGDLGAIELPKKAIQKEGEQAYVLVNDFGTIIRRDVQVGQENGDKMAIESGLESADRVVISSKKPVKVGDIVESDAAIASDESATNESMTDASK